MDPYPEQLGNPTRSQNSQQLVLGALKTLLRKENAGTQTQTTDCIGKLLKEVTPKTSANYLQTAGYAT